MLLVSATTTACFVVATQLDVRNWNSICGAQTRVYDASMMAALTTGGLWKRPFFIDVFQLSPRRA